MGGSRLAELYNCILPAAVQSFQEEAGAGAAELSMADNGDPVPEEVCLVHVVSGEQDRTSGLEFQQQIPDLNHSHVSYKSYMTYKAYSYLLSAWSPHRVRMVCACMLPSGGL